MNPFGIGTQELIGKCSSTDLWNYRVFREYTITIPDYCSNMSKNAQAECKVKARFRALLRRSRFSRQSLKERTKQQGTIRPVNSLIQFFTSSLNRSILECFLCHLVHSYYNYKL